MSERVQVEPHPGDGRGTASPDRLPRPPRRWPVRWWHRTAGAAAIVAVLVVGNATTADATVTPRRPSKAEIDTAAGARSDGPVHGEFTVLDADGVTQTRRWQWGVVVDVDETGLTVASDDGFSSDYHWAGSQTTDVTVGDVVTVVGTVTGDPGDDV